LLETIFHFFTETLWLRLIPVTRHSVEFEVDQRVSCLVQVVGYPA
jgi:hypothetical protein